MIFSVSICSETDIQNCHLPIPAITFNSVLKIMIYEIIQLPDCIFQGKKCAEKSFSKHMKMLCNSSIAIGSFLLSFNIKHAHTAPHIIHI